MKTHHPVRSCIFEPGYYSKIIVPVSNDGAVVNVNFVTWRSSDKSSWLAGMRIQLSYTVQRWTPGIIIGSVIAAARMQNSFCFLNYCGLTFAELVAVWRAHVRYGWCIVASSYSAHFNNLKKIALHTDVRLNVNIEANKKSELMLMRHATASF